MVSYISAKEEIKRTADILEVIGQVVQLRKAGRNYVGLCPFHAEKAPSFTVSPERQMFHCFGCKKGGDIFAFWMAYHRYTFPEALKDLAERYHVKISEGPPTREENRMAALRETIFKLNQRSAIYFQEMLRDPKKGGTAREYLNKRALTDEIVSEFRIGFAPQEWDGLTEFLRGDPSDMKVAVQAGLIVPKKNGGYYDRFRGRIIFPIFNLRQQVIGFGGRVLDDSLPKYLNTSETPVFRKGESLYGLNVSYKAIRQKGRAVVVEGYMDFLALRMHDLEEVVATLGTALTGEHVRKLKGYANEVLVVFDPDEAGRRALLKSLPLFLNEGVTAKAVVLPDGHDPDDFVNEEGLVPFLGVLDASQPIFDYYMQQKLSRVSSDVEEKVRVVEEVLPVLSGLRNTTQRSLYVRRLADQIGIKEQLLWSGMKDLKNKPGKAGETDLGERLRISKAEKRSVSDSHLLNLLIHYPGSVSGLLNCDWRLLVSDATVQEIIDVYCRRFAQIGPFSAEELLDNLETDAAREQFREALLKPPFYSKDMVDLAVSEFEERVEQKRISASIRDAKARGNIQDLNRLLKLKAQRPVRS
jgi:DNA primase